MGRREPDGERPHGRSARGEARFLAAAAETIEHASATLLAAYRERADAPPAAAFENAVAALLRFCADDPVRARAYLVETAICGPRGAELWRAHMRELSRQATCALRAVNPDLPPHAAAMAIGGVYTVARTRVLAGRVDELPELGPDLTRALWLTLGIDSGNR